MSAHVDLFLVKTVDHVKLQCINLFEKLWVFSNCIILLAEIKFKSLPNMILKRSMTRLYIPCAKHQVIIICRLITNWLYHEIKGYKI